MVKYKSAILIILSGLFLLFSYYPTLYELSQKDKLLAKGRDFILEHNYYWPDFNLYLSKIRQGYENSYLAVEKYTSESHKGSLIQIFYLYLGKFGALLKIEPNYAYQLGRINNKSRAFIIVSIFERHFFQHGFKLLNMRTLRNINSHTHTLRFVALSMHFHYPPFG